MANMEKAIKESFIQYAGAVAQSRALVDARDGLKPSARQIFYCLYTDKFLPDKPFKKTLKAVGSAARMYIHGDSSCVGVIMRASQPFSMRYPLIEVDGNCGTPILSGNWSAPRYTESRLSKVGTNLFEDINKDTIEEWRDNYDDTEQYPSVLPSKGFYNLCNGTMGIAVGLASSIPQFNLKEMNKALETLLLNPNCDFDEIYCAPDFATGAVLLNASEVREALKNGQGCSCKLRSVVDWDNKERCFVVTQIPYSVYTNTICGELKAIEEDPDNNPGIERHNDLTGADPLIKIYLTKNANPDKVLRFLYKNTSLQSYFGINLTMLDNGRFPKVFGWREALQAHIDHEKTVYRRGFEFDLNKIKDRIHIIDGLLICLASIDEVVHTIKNSSSAALAAIELQKNFLLDAVQAKAVLDMKLSRLAHLEVQKLENEREELLKEAEHIESILNDTNLFNQELIKGWREVAQKFGDARRTQILDLSNEKEETIEVKQLSLSFTNENAIFVTETSTLYSQKRNGVGSKFKMEKGEFIVDNLVGKNTDTIIFFTSHGNFYHAKLSEFNVNTKLYLNSFITLLPYETIVSATIVSGQKNNIIFVTKNGIIKKSEISEYNLSRNTGAKAINLDNGDEIIAAYPCNDERVGILTKKGNLVILETKDIRPIGRVARGVIGIKLNDGDSVISSRVIPADTKQIFTIAADGLSKRTDLTEFRVTGRGTKGVRAQRSELMSDFLPLTDNDKEILVTSTMAQIRVPVKELAESGRDTQGTKAIKLQNTDCAISVSKI